ncbi:OsmC family protein [Virgibacillus alimentarius]|uniref:Peroxiredoxin-like protein n=1 Tax=Virgibacillus alimentarius TaxID=698769 RepID=A0ABS4S8Y7_9BACI|nr:MULTISPECIES: OsmC family protein [Virgibacillus]MBP2257958.1 peroxiredoxin-like protein [Virgibacillus alimentarius]HLR66553.1 OsmC family protein [Virgibacillus sp.]
MAEHHFHLKADWPGGRNRDGYIEAGNLQTKISIPTEMNGPGIGTNPDEMLLGAAATCYVITLAAMIEHAKLPLKEMSLESEGIVDVTNGVITYKKIIHKPSVTLQEDALEEDDRKLRKLIYKAEKSCMISRALRGNVEMELQPNI